MAYTIHDLNPTSLAPPNEALQIEELRKELMLGSEEIPLGNDHHRERTVSQLSRSAIALAASAAPMFEKLHTLNIAHANVHAGGTKWHNMRTISGLSRQALRVAYPRTKDTATNQLNLTDIATRRRAIRLTSPDLSFSGALEEAWTQFGHPIGPLIDTTEDINLASRQAAAQQQPLIRVSGTLIESIEADTGALHILK